MKIILRKKPSGKGKSSLYLDLYINHQRHYEFLKLHLFQVPKTAREREHNKETEQLAENIKAKRQLELQNTEHGFRSITNKRVDFLEFFLKLTKEREATGVNYHCWDSVSKHLTRFLNGKKIRVESVDERFLKGFKEHLLSVVSTNSAQNYFHKVQSALHEAIRRGIITRCEGLHNVEAPRHEETKKEFLTIEELRSLTVAECKFDVLKRAFLFSALTSLRWSDVHALCWENVKYSENTGWSIHFTQQKTHQCEYLVISQQARDFLGEPQESKSRVFVGLKYSAYMNVELQRWMMRAGITRNITFHSARHTAATLMLTYGADIYTVSKVLGHKDVKTTQIYAKIVDQKKVDAVNCLPQLSL